MDHGTRVSQTDGKITSMHLGSGSHLLGRLSTAKEGRAGRKLGRHYYLYLFGRVLTIHQDTIKPLPL
jgi:hypothetical protein